MQKCTDMLRFQRLRFSDADFRHFRYRFQRLRFSGADFRHFRYRFQRLRFSDADFGPKSMKKLQKLAKTTKSIYFFLPIASKAELYTTPRKNTAIGPFRTPIIKGKCRKIMENGKFINRLSYKEKN